MTILTYTFDKGDSAGRDFHREAIIWLVRHRGRCAYTYESGRAKFAAQFKSVMASMDIPLDETVILQGSDRARVKGGDGWTVVRMSRITRSLPWGGYIYQYDHKCEFHIKFDDEMLALQFKLALS